MRPLSLLVAGFMGFSLSSLALAGSSPGRPTNSTLEAVQRFLVISSTLAHVTDVSLPSGNKMPEYIVIQDVHKHPEVQSCIAALILEGYHRWGIRTVFLEGAFTGVDVSLFHRLPDQTRAVLLSRLVKAGDLSGPEWAAILLSESEWRNPPQTPFQILGMEDPKVYRENVLAYQEVVSHREEALEEITSIRRMQNGLQLPKSNLLAQQLDRTESLVRLKLTPNEYEAYNKAEEAIPSSPKLDPAIQAAERFYALVQKRSEIFLGEAQKKLPASPGPRVLVVGGFHTPSMTDALRRKGRSFVVLTPHVAEGASEAIYEKHLMESISALQMADALSAQ